MTTPRSFTGTPGTGSSAVRHIRSRFGSRQVSDLLQNLFAAEIVAPSRCLWIVSPWISDIVLLDNQTNAFTTVAREWPRTQIRLAGALAHLIRRGTGVVIATRPDDHNIEFLTRLEAAVGKTDRLKIHKTHSLHEKGLLGDKYYLSGSMNLTYNGITFNEEVLHFFTDAANVAATRYTFINRWGVASSTESVE